jgi:glucokinase
MAGQHAEVSGIGADLGGTKVSAVVVAPDGGVIRSVYRAHDGTAAGAVASLSALLAELVSGSSGRVGVGVAAAGLIDRSTGDLVHSALLDLHSVTLATTLSALVGTEVIVENDANAALLGALGEVGAHETSLLFALGTGVGGALSVGDAVVQGSFGFAAELGHIPVEPPGRHPCPCGSSGCLELFASGTAVAAAGRSAGLTDGDGGPPRAEDVVAAARAGHPAGIRILESAGAAVGTALAGLIPAFDPATVYLSGGFGHGAADLLVPAIERRIRDQLPFPRARPAPRILADPVGPLAAAIGVARLARRRAHDPHLRKGSE